MEGTIINWRLPENRKVLNSSFLDCEDEEEDEILIKYPSKRRKLKYSNETPSTSIYSEEQEKPQKMRLQSKDCYDLPINDSIYPRCEECYQKQLTENYDITTNDNSCRFKNFRRYPINLTKKDQPKFPVANEADVEQWMNSPSSRTTEMAPAEACYIVSTLSRQFDVILRQEREFLAKYRNFEILNVNGWVAWKQPFTHVREVCDVCSRTIFNLHLFCERCGYTVCQRCAVKCQSKRSDRFNCPNARHSRYNMALKLAQIIPDTEHILRTLETLNSQLQMVLEQHRNGDSKDIDESNFRRCTCGIEPIVDDDFKCDYYFDGELLVINDMTHKNALAVFQNHWRKFRPIIVRNIDRVVNFGVWNATLLQELSQKPSLSKGSVQDCITGYVTDDFDIDSFWEGFLDVNKRSENSRFKLKDWPTNTDLASEFPIHYANFCESLPFSNYSHPTNGVYSLTTHLPQFCLKPDLGPKLYCAYEMIDSPLNGSTNLHIDSSDAVNLLMNVTIPKNTPENFYDKIIEYLKTQGLHSSDFEQVLANKERVGALWTIFNKEDTDKIRSFMKKFKLVKKYGKADPIHDQMIYLHADLRKQLKDECNVVGFSFVQMLGDAVFIPAGAAHQVQNMVCCVKMAEDFVSPESVDECAKIDEEFRRLSSKHENHADKLQLPNVIVHSMKEALRAMAQNILLTS